MDDYGGYEVYLMDLRAEEDYQELGEYLDQLEQEQEAIETIIQEKTK